MNEDQTVFVIEAKAPVATDWKAWEVFLTEEVAEGALRKLQGDMAGDWRITPYIPWQTASLEAATAAETVNAQR